MHLLSLIGKAAVTSPPLCIITTNFCIIVFPTRSLAAQHEMSLMQYFPAAGAPRWKKLLDDQKTDKRQRDEGVTGSGAAGGGEWPRMGEQTLRGVKYEQKQTRRGAKSIDILQSCCWTEAVLVSPQYFKDLHVHLCSARRNKYSQTNMSIKGNLISGENARRVGTDPGDCVKYYKN